MAEHGQPVPGQGLYLLAKNVWVETLARALPDLSSEQNKKQNGAKTKQNKTGCSIPQCCFVPQCCSIPQCCFVPQCSSIPQFAALFYHAALFHNAALFQNSRLLYSTMLICSTMLLYPTMLLYSTMLLCSTMLVLPQSSLIISHRSQAIGQTSDDGYFRQ